MAVMFISCHPSIKIIDNALKEVDIFKYLWSQITQNAFFTSKIKHRVSLANQVYFPDYTIEFGSFTILVSKPKSRFTIWLFSEIYYTRLNAKHIQKLKTFDMRSLRTLALVSWKDMISNEKVLNQTNMLKMNVLIRIRHLWWVGDLRGIRGIL